MATSRRDDDDESRRISQLPKDILQRILSLLSQKEAIQTCVLSKSWRHLVYTRPDVHLRESSENRYDKELFMSSLEKTLQTYQEHKQTIQDLHVEMSALDSKSSSIIGKLVKDMNVVTFRLVLSTDWYDQQDFPLPRLIFQADSLKEIYLTGLKLTNRIDDEKVRFKHLKTLHLKESYIEDEIFANIISNCPLIEYLVLDSCEGLKTIKLDKAHNLTRFVFSPINAVVLGNISFLNNHFPHLKSLCLGYVRLSAESFDNLSSNNYFPCLEELELDYCDVYEEEFVLSSRSIKRLIFRNVQCKGTVDAESILYFKVSTSLERTPSISLTTTSREWKSHINVNGGVGDNDDVSTCLHKVNELLKALSQSQITFKPSDHDFLTKKMHFMGDPAVVELLDLSRYQNRSFPSEVHGILICFFRICRPRYIIGMCSSVTLETQLRGSGGRKSCNSKIIIKDRVGKRTKTLCFLQQDLEEIRSEVWDHNAKKWNSHALRKLSCETQCALSDKKHIRYRLKWRGEKID